MPESVLPFRQHAAALALDGWSATPPAGHDVSKGATLAAQAHCPACGRVGLQPWWFSRAGGQLTLAVCRCDAWKLLAS